MADVELRWLSSALPWFGIPDFGKGVGCDDVVFHILSCPVSVTHIFAEYSVAEHGGEHR